MTLKLKAWMATLGLLPLMYHLPRPAVGGQIDETIYDFSRYSKEVPSILRPIAAKMLNVTEEQIAAMHPLDIAVEVKPRMQMLPRWVRWKFDVPSIEVIEAWERKRKAELQEPAQVEQLKQEAVPKGGAGDDVKQEPAAFTFLHLWLPAVLLAAFLFHYYKPLRLRSRQRRSRLTFMGGPPCCSSESTVVREPLGPTSHESLKQEVESLVDNLAYVPGNVHVWRSNESNGFT